MRIFKWIMNINKVISNRKLIVLMYHGTPSHNPTSKFSIHTKEFVQQIKYLKKTGWSTACVKDVSNPHLLPDKNILLTFDDGFADNYHGAFLPLLELGMNATWFISTDYIGKHALWMGDKSEQTKMLSSDQLKEMHQQGMEIASHTCSHPDLSKLDYANQLKELTQSKKTLESIIEEPVSSFAYPYGRYNQQTIQAVEEAGYNKACSVRPGFYKADENPMLIRRVTIFDTDTVSTLARKLRFADNDVSWNRIVRYYGQRIYTRICKPIDHE